MKSAYFSTQAPVRKDGNVCQLVHPTLVSRETYCIFTTPVQVVKKSNMDFHEECVDSPSRTTIRLNIFICDMVSGKLMATFQHHIFCVFMVLREFRLISCHFIYLFIRTAHVNQHFWKHASVTELANFQLRSFGKMF